MSARHAPKPAYYLRGLELDDREISVTISHLKVERVKSSGVTRKRPVLYFSGIDRGLVLNKGNAQTIAAMYGDDAAQWIGKKIVIHRERFEFSDSTIDVVRVKREAAS